MEILVAPIPMILSPSPIAPNSSTFSLASGKRQDVCVPRPEATVFVKMQAVIMPMICVPMDSCEYDW